MENVTGMQKLTRIGRIKKPTDEILRSEPEKLLLLSTELEKHGESIVEPQHLYEGIQAVSNDDSDFEGVLSLIWEVLILHLGLALAINQGLGVWEYMQVYDSMDVKELTRTDYYKLRQEILNPIREAAVVPHQIQGSTGVALQPGKRSSAKKPSKSQTPPTTKKIQKH